MLCSGYNREVAKARRRYGSYEAAKAALKRAYKSTWQRYVEAPDPGETLYHYCPQPTAFKILESGKRWASDALRMNDATEITYAHDVIDTVVGERENGIPKYLIKSVKPAQTVRDIWSTWCTHISCLSSEGDLPSQWEKYAAKGEGVAIGFDRQELTKVCNQQGISLFPISYDRRCHERTIRALLERATAIEIERGLQPPDRDEFRKDVNVYLASLAMTMKNSDWRHEHNPQIPLFQH